MRRGFLRVISASSNCNSQQLYLRLILMYLYSNNIMSIIHWCFGVAIVQSLVIHSGTKEYNIGKVILIVYISLYCVSKSVNMTKPRRGRSSSRLPNSTLTTLSGSLYAPNLHRLLPLSLIDDQSLSSNDVLQHMHV